jgi:hypothetical protein
MASNTLVECVANARVTEIGHRLKVKGLNRGISALIFNIDIR